METADPPIDECHASGMPLGFTRRPPRKPRGQAMSFGGLLLNKLDPDRQIFTPDEQNKLLECENGTEITELLNANLDFALAPSLAEAQEVFSGLLAEPLTIPPLVMSLRAYSIAQQMISLEAFREVAKNGKSRPERQDARNRAQAATQELSVMVNRMEQLAVLLGCIKPSANPPPAEAPKPVVSAVAPELD